MAECLSAIGISTLTTTVMVIAWRRPKPVFLAPLDITRRWPWDRGKPAAHRVWGCEKDDDEAMVNRLRKEHAHPRGNPRPLHLENVAPSSSLLGGDRRKQKEVRYAHLHHPRSFHAPVCKGRPGKARGQACSHFQTVRAGGR